LIGAPRAIGEREQRRRYETGGRGVEGGGKGEEEELDKLGGRS